MQNLHGWGDDLSIFREAGQAYINVIETTPGQQAVTVMNVARTFTAWVKFRQTINELGGMSNRELHYLGIERSDIRRIARSASL